MPDVFNLPAVEKLSDLRTGRLVLYQSGRLVHVPILGILGTLVDQIYGPALLLSGDMQETDLDRLLLEDDGDFLLD